MWTNSLHGILISKGILTVPQVQHAMAVTLGTATTWLEHLLLSRQLDERTVVRCVCADACLPACDLDQLAHLPSEVVAMLPGDLAVEHRMIPLSVEPDGDLCVGMVNPYDVVAVKEVEFFLRLRLLREVVPATSLAWALSTYYGARCVLWPSQSPSRAIANMVPSRWCEVGPLHTS